MIYSKKMFQYCPSQKSYNFTRFKAVIDLFLPGLNFLALYLYLFRLQNKLMKFLFSIVFLLTFQLQTLAQKFTTSLDNNATYQKLAGKPLSSKYGNVASIKVILETGTGKLYFINSDYYEFHYEFAVDQLKAFRDLLSFNEDNYSNRSKRQYLLANVNCNEASGTYYLDLSVFDLMPQDRIIQLVKQVKANTFFGEKLVFLLNTDRLMAVRTELEKSIRTTTPAEIYANIDYQAISEGTVEGKLRFEPDLSNLKTPLLPTDILVTTATPEFLPLVRGMLLTSLQTPLSHLVILGQNRGIPIGVYTGLFEDSTIRSLEGQWVALTIVSDTFNIRKTKPQPTTTVPANPIRLKRNLITDSLMSAQSLTLADAGTYGNKASNFGILTKLSKNGGFKTPEAAFGIPFYWYELHLRQSGALELINGLIAHPVSDPDSLTAALKAIRKRIQQSPVDALLLSKLRARLEQSGYTTFRFRSSTNAEDAAGFSGAGLYDSKTVDLKDSTKTAEEALQKVWASLWSYQAYLERSYFNIAPADVSMGILVHRSFPNEAANGVAITKNIYRSSYAGFVINVQKGDFSVVAPDSGVVCDQVILYPSNELSGFQRTIEVITTSNLNNGELVMTKEELLKLQTELEKIKQYYWRHIHKRKPGEVYDQFGLDLEFKLDEVTRELYIKQVREYNY